MAPFISLKHKNLRGIKIDYLERLEPMFKTKLNHFKLILMKIFLLLIQYLKIKRLKNTTNE